MGVAAGLVGAAVVAAAVVLALEHGFEARESVSLVLALTDYCCSMRSQE